MMLQLKQTSKQIKILKIFYLQNIIWKKRLAYHISEHVFWNKEISACFMFCAVDKNIRINFYLTIEIQSYIDGYEIENKLWFIWITPSCHQSTPYFNDKSVIVFHHFLESTDIWFTILHRVEYTCVCSIITCTCVGKPSHIVVQTRTRYDVGLREILALKTRLHIHKCWKFWNE